MAGELKKEVAMVGRFSFLLAIVFCCSVSVAEEAVEIPLSEVWGMNLLETKPVAQLDPERHGKQNEKPLSPEEIAVRQINSLTYQIHRSLADKSPDVRSILPGFAVLGKRWEALEERPFGACRKTTYSKYISRRQ